MTFYRHILKRAWEVTWKFRYLWFFGLFAALLGNGGEYEIIYRNFADDGNSLSSSLSDIASTGIFTPHGLMNALKTAVVDPVNFSIIIITLIVGLALTAFLIWLIIVCQAALVSGSAKIIQNKKTIFKEALQAGMAKFWPVLFLNAISAFIVSIFGRAILSVQSSGFFYVLLFIVFIPLAIVISFIIKYSIGYAVIKGEKFFASLVAGLRLFKENWVISIEMALLLALINVGMGLAAALAVMTIAIPLLFLVLLFIKASFIAGFYLVVITGLALLFVLICLTGAIIATFQTSAWTGLFIELLDKGGVSKIARIFGAEK